MSDRKNTVNVFVLAGSLRSSSLNHRLAELACTVMNEHGANAVHEDLRSFVCPPYDGDDEAESGLPPAVHALHKHIVAADALVIASPEYNAAMPGVLKNIIDWQSRVRPQPFKGKQCLLMSASPSMAGGNRGLWSLRVPLEHLGTRVYPDMFSLAQAHEAFDSSGRIANAQLMSFFESTIGCFLDLTEAAKNYPAMKSQWIEFLGEKPTPETTRVEAA
jgi:chromate reductase, NAD(P)H dehydrogenase (quinone)